MDDVIDVVCLALPDGTTLWYEPGDGRPDELIAAWKQQLPAEKRQLYESCGVLGGFVILRMLRQDYQSIPATSHSHAIFKAWASRPAGKG